jgi:hypothetical protein
MIGRDDSVLMKRALIIGAAIFLFTFVFHRLDRMYARKFFDDTGNAQWIWAQHPTARDLPVAFFATRDFELPAARAFTKIKVAADPEYALYFNGQQIGGRRGEDGKALDVYDVSALAKTGKNRIVIAARSANGVGGIIAAVDTRPDFHLVATDARWNIIRRWSDDLLYRDPPRAYVAKPRVIGPPPAGRWNYLTSRVAEPVKPIKRVVEPLRVFPVDAALPIVNIVGGVAVAGSERAPAIAYEFGNVWGRLHLITQPGNAGSLRVRVRFTNSIDDLAPAEGNLESFVFAAGEQAITEPRDHGFRYVLVYGGDATPRVVE